MMVSPMKSVQSTILRSQRFCLEALPAKFNKLGIAIRSRLLEYRRDYLAERVEFALSSAHATAVKVKSPMPPHWKCSLQFSSVGTCLVGYPLGVL